MEAPIYYVFQNYCRKCIHLESYTATVCGKGFIEERLTWACTIGNPKIDKFEKSLPLADGEYKNPYAGSMHIPQDCAYNLEILIGNS